MCVGLWHWPPGWAIVCGWALFRSKKDLVSLHPQNVSSFRCFCFVSFINAAPLLSSGLWLLFPALGQCLLAGHLWNSGANIFAVCDAVTTILPWGRASGTKATFLTPLHPPQAPAIQGCWVLETFALGTPITEGKLTELCLVALPFTCICPRQGSLYFTSLLASSRSGKIATI